MKRLFIAIKTSFSKETVEFFEEVKNYFNNEKIKWVNFNHLHITLKFLGNTEKAIIPQIMNSLEKTSSNYQKFLLEFKGMGVFKNFNNPRVLWIGINKNETLLNLQKEIEYKMYNLGFQKETREFNPHLTLGRIKLINSKKRFINYILKNSVTFFEKIEVENFYLIESVLTPHGPIYKDIKKYNLV